MKNMKQIIYMALLGGVALSCTQSELGTGSPESELPTVPLEIASASLPEGSLTVTRATTPQPLTSGSIGLFLQGKEAATSYTAINNSKYTYEEAISKWQPATDDQTIYLGGEAAHICAYYPHQESGYDNKTQLPLTMQEYDVSKELFFAPNQEKNATPADRKLTLNLTHAYSQIELNITRENYPTQCTISGITLKNGNLLTTGTINITDGTVTGTPGSYALEKLPYTLVAGDTYTHNLLVPPSTLSADATDSNKGLAIVLTVDSKPMTVKIPLSELPTLEKGKKHVISLKIKGTAIETAVTTTGWDEKTLNGGTAYEPVPVVVSASLESGLKTRAASASEALADGSKIGVFRVADEVAGYEAVSNTLYTLNGSTWASGSPIYVSGKEAKLCAYYPYSATQTTSTVTLTAQTYAADKDVCFAKVDGAQHIKNTAPSVTFAMERAYSQLTLAMTRDYQYPLVCKVTAVKLEMEGGQDLMQTKTLNIENESMADGTTATSLSYTTAGAMHDTGLTASVTDKTFRLLLPPQTLPNAGLKLTLTIDDWDYSVVIPHAALTAFERGSNHVISLKITDGEPITLADVSTKEWDDTGGTHSGDASPIQ